MNTKALIFSLSLVFVTLGAFISLIVIVNNLEKKVDPVRTVGERALEVLHASAETEEILFYLEQTGAIAAENAVEVLVNNAGLFNSECGLIKDNNANYIYWNNPQQPDKTCFETDIYANYQTYFNRHLNPYFQLKSNIPLNTYDVFIIDRKEISAIAEQPITITLVAPQKLGALPLGLYTFKPSFTIRFNHDFSPFNQLKQFARDVLMCKKITREDQENCITALVGASPVKIALQSRDKTTFLFDVQEETFPIKFALFVPIS